MEMITLIVIGAVAAWALIWAYALDKKVVLLGAWARQIALERIVEKGQMHLLTPEERAEAEKLEAEKLNDQ